MNEIKALVARLIQNPDLVKSLPKAFPKVFPKVLNDPQALAQLAGLGEDKLKTLAGLGNTLSGLLGRLGKPAPPGVSPRRPAPRSSPAGSGGVRNTAIVGAVSLTAVAGAVVAVGTVSAVALSRGRKQHLRESR